MLSARAANSISSALSASIAGICCLTSSLAFWAKVEDQDANLEEARTAGLRLLSLERAEGLAWVVVVDEDVGGCWKEADRKRLSYGVSRGRRVRLGIVVCDVWTGTGGLGRLCERGMTGNALLQLLQESYFTLNDGNTYDNDTDVTGRVLLQENVAKESGKEESKV